MQKNAEGVCLVFSDLFAFKGKKMGCYQSILFSIILLYSTLGLAEYFSPPPVNFDPKQPSNSLTFDVFPISSEIQIGKIKPMIDRAPEGMYVTVGSERGFRAASMMKQITYLWLLDLSDKIIQFNLINRELLKIPSRTEYLHLRWDASFSEWQKIKGATLSQSDFDWWVKHVRDLEHSAYQLPEYLNKHQRSPKCRGKGITKAERKLDLAQILDYKSGNYLFKDDLYQNIHRLAVENKILVSKIDLNNTNQFNQLLNYFQRNHLKIGVLDLDNLYYSDYLGQDNYVKIVEQLLPYGMDNSMLITMFNYKNYACGQYQIYLGFTFDNARNWSKMKMQDFFESMPKEVSDLIDGRVYEKGDKMPCFDGCH